VLPLPKEMRALVYHGKDDLRVETVPVPRIGPGELLVKVAVCGVCPTDIKKIKYGTVPSPRIFGHETAGTIVKAGAGVRGFRVGQRVALHHHVPCLDCHACRHRTFAQCTQYKRTGITAGFEPAGGGFAEYVRVMPFVLPGVVPIPAKNTFEEGAMLEPVNTVLKAVRRLNILPGDTVLIIGQGPIGLMFTALLNLERVDVLAVDFMPERLAHARKFGAKWTLTPDQLKQAGRAVPGTPRVQERAGRVTPATQRNNRKNFRFPLSPFRFPLVDAAIITAPSDAAVRDCHALVRGGGQVLLFAHTTAGAETPIDLSLVCVQERDLIGSYSADFTLQREVARIVFSRKLDVRSLISHRFPLEHAAQAIEVAAHPTPQSLKILVNAPGTA
jgi:L-iditol 2-dehydrogenase